MNKKQIVLGDPCYILKDEDYTHIWGELNHWKNGDLIDEKGVLIGVVQQTAYGDGCYQSGSEYYYSVDSGTLGIFDCSKFELNDDAKDYARMIEIDGDLQTISAIEDDGLITLSWVDESGEHNEKINTKI